MQRFKYIHFKICRSTSLFASCWHRRRQSLFAHAYIQSVVLVENGALYRTALTHFNGWKTKILSLRLRYELISKRLNYQSKYTNTSGRAHANPFNWKCRCKFWQFLGPRLCLLFEVSCDDELPRRSVLLKLFLLIAGPLILVFSFHPTPGSVIMLCKGLHLKKLAERAFFSYVYISLMTNTGTNLPSQTLTSQ